MESKRALIAQLRQYRMANRLSAPALAKKLGVNDGTVYGWEHGRCLPSDMNIYAIKKLLRGG